MSDCVNCGDYRKPIVEFVDSNQATYVSIGEIANLYFKNPIKKLFKSSISWTLQSEYSSNPSVDEYISFLGSALSNNTSISPEIWKYNKDHYINNNDFSNFLKDILFVIVSKLGSKVEKDNISINIDIVKDVEYPDWEEFVITIKFPSNVINYDEYFYLWEEIGEHVKEKINSINVQDKRIFEKYGSPIILLEEPI